MHHTFLCPSMDEASRWLENITDHQQVIPTSDSKSSLDPPLVDQVVDLDLYVVDPTLPLKSEVEVVNPSPSLIDLTLPSESEVVESMSYPPDPTLSSESVKIEVVSLNKNSSCSSLTIENEPKPAKVFMLHYDCSLQ